jgi:phosphoribosylaminoimidazole (AIR) synthetase
VPVDEMFRVFNMGIGLVAVVPEDRLASAADAAPEATVIGRVKRRENDGDAVDLIGAGIGA